MLTPLLVLILEFSVKIVKKSYFKSFFKVCRLKMISVKFSTSFDLLENKTSTILIEDNFKTENHANTLSID